MAQVIVRYWAAAKEAAGTDSEKLSAETLAELLDAAAAAHPSGSFARVLSRSSFLIDGTQAGPDPAATRLSDGAVVEILPAFAGG
jgi:molybdopterin synthase sulfur carrier subunit